MRNKIIKNLINYWIRSSKYLFSYQERINIPGFSIDRSLDQVYEIDKSKTENILEIISKVSHKKVDKKSAERWNQGWGQNYDDIHKNKTLVPYIVPYYFGKYPLSRIMGKFITTKSYEFPRNLDEIKIPLWDIPAIDRWNSIEHNLVRLMMHNLVYVPFIKNILRTKKENIYFYELGAGTTHNLYFLKKFIDYHLPENNAKYIALDWSKSTGLITKKMDNNFSYQFINYYEPETFPILHKNAFIFSLASLEQINISSEKLLSYLAESNPNLVINIEPISQTLSKNSSLDEQSINYMNERNYLPDFISSILNIKMNKFHSLEYNLFRSGVGSQFIDGYSVVEWFVR